MMKVVLLLAVLLVFVLAPCGDLVSKDKPWDDGNDGGPSDGGPEGEDHPWGGENQTPGDIWNRLSPLESATGVFVVDALYRLPGIDTYLESRLFWVRTDRPYRDIQKKNRGVTDVPRQENSSIGSYGVEK
ncbi:MAG TPA: hypothetical protein VMY05_05870 [Acidobacteriota bacterium]|nr:hypothetical protein [Acidobacteriota bacterium]